MQHKVVIVIPVYTHEINQWEEISLRQCVAILGHYPIVFIAPKSLDTTLLENISGIKNIERFDDSCFLSLSAYNYLMLSEEFYERFIGFENMLIYQLDAYVFSDRLLEWCKRGYDYIGAPWIPSVKYSSFIRRTELRVYQSISRKLGIYGSRSNYFHTGNGGFSLRKIKTFLEVTKSDKHHINRFLKHDQYHKAEDVYWGIKANRIKQRLKIPTYKEAIGFAFENRPAQLYHDNGEQLPFGAHAWYKGDRLKFWSKFITLPQEK